MTAQALAEHLEVSERTIYRDIEALSSAGIPLYTERGPGGGCELIDGYQTKLTGLTAAEVRALFLLSVSGPLADLGLSQALEDALLKLSAALPTASRANAAQVRQRILVDTTLPAHSRQARAHLEVIQEAVWQDRTLWLTYGGQSRHAIDPYGLVSKASAWYLVGATTGQVQVVRVSRIQAAELTDQHFIRPVEFDLATYWAERISLTNHYQAGSRSSQPLKKAKMRACLPARRKKRKNDFYSTLFCPLNIPNLGVRTGILCETPRCLSGQDSTCLNSSFTWCLPA
jgi:predicted DNA-binding transcriptional regulator YafY